MHFLENTSLYDVIVENKNESIYISVETRLSLSGRVAMDGGVYQCLTLLFTSLQVLLTVNLPTAQGK